MNLILNYKGATFEIEYTYYPEEPQTLYSPKLYEEAEIEKIWWLCEDKLANIYSLMESLDLIYELSGLVLKRHKELVED